MTQWKPLHISNIRHCVGSVLFQQIVRCWQFAPLICSVEPSPLAPLPVLQPPVPISSQSLRDPSSHLIRDITICIKILTSACIGFLEIKLLPQCVVSSFPVWLAPPFLLTYLHPGSKFRKGASEQKKRKKTSTFLHNSFGSLLLSLYKRTGIWSNVPFPI